MAAPHPDFVKQVVVDITPSAQGQENLLAMFAGSILSDVKASRRSADVDLLQQVVDLAFIAGFNTYPKVGSGDGDATKAFIAAARQRLQDLVR